MKKRSVFAKSVLILSMLFLLAFSLAACNLDGNGGVSPPPPQITYNVTFNVNGGSAVEPMNEITVIETEPVTTREGFTFGGWYTDEATATERVQFPLTLTSNIVLYAKWTPIPTYSVKFYTNQGSTLEELQNVTVLTEEMLGETTRQGYRFAGWYLDRGLTSALTLPMTLSEDISLFAKWDKIIYYNVTFNVNGGSAAEPITVEAGQSIESAPATERANYELVGWYTEQSFENKVEFPFIPQASVTLYAKWIGVERTITFDYDGATAGNELPSKTVRYGEKIGELPVPEKTDENFYGWVYKKQGEPAVPVTAETYFNFKTDITITANWQLLEMVFTESADGNYYTVGDGETAAYASREIQSVEIPSEFDDGIHGALPVKAIAKYAFINKQKLTSITIPKSIVSIGEAAFSGCGFTSATILNGVNYAVGVYRSSSALTSVVIEEGVTSLPDETFRNCYNLNTVTFPLTLETIGAKAFQSAGLTSLVLNEGLKAIGDYAFNYDNRGFTDTAITTGVTLPSTLTSIGKYAFMNRKGLTEVRFANGFSLDALPDGVFEGTGITEISIPASVKKIGSAFSDCTLLETVNYAADNALTEIGNGAFFNTALREARIPAGVTLIGNNAYSAKEVNASKIASVIFEGDKVTTIGSSAFKGAVFTSVELPNSVVSIDRSLFENCRRLVTVVSLGSVTELPAKIFADCSALKYTIPANITKIGNQAFVNCTAMTSFTIPSNVKTIENSAFHGMSRLASITIEEGVTTLGSNLFRNCSSLTEMHLPASVETLSDPWNQVLGGNLNKLKKISVAEGSPLFKSIDGVLYSSDGTKMFCYPSAKGVSTYTVPEGVTELASGFQSPDLLSLVLPKSLTSFPDRMVANSVNLKAVVINNPKMEMSSLELFVTAMPTYPEIYAKYVPKVYLPAGSEEFYTNDPNWQLFRQYIQDVTLLYGDGYEVNSVGLLLSVLPGITDLVVPERATIVSYMNNYVPDADVPQTDNVLKSVTLHPGVTQIAGNAFVNCTALTTVNMAGANVDILHSAFSGCTSLSTIDLSNVKSIGAKAFDGCTALESADLSKVTSLGNYAFRGCSNLSSVTLSNSLSEINMGAFKNTGLTSVNVPASVTTIGTEAFYGCSALSAVTLNEGLNLIGSSAFGGCAISSLTIPASVSTIDRSAFKDCGSLASVTFNEGLQIIGESAFENTALSSVSIPASVTSIGINAFKGCTGLNDLTIAGTNTAIDADAFSGANITAITTAATGLGAINGLSTTLQTLTLSEGVTDIPDNAFKGFGALTTVNLPSTLKTIGANAFQNCAALASITLNDGLQTIGANAFAGTALTAISVPSTVTSIGEGAFPAERIANLTIATPTVGKVLGADNTTLQTLNVSEGVTEISDNAFKGYTALTTVNLPSTLTRIGASAFEGSGLTAVNIPAAVETMGANTFKGASALASIKFGNGSKLTEIPERFAESTAITEINIPWLVYRIIPSLAFGQCAQLTDIWIENLCCEVVLPEGNGLLGNITQTVSIHVPDNMRSGGNVYAPKAYQSDAPSKAVFINYNVTGTADADGYVITDEILNVNGKSLYVGKILIGVADGLTDFVLPAGVQGIGFDALGNTKQAVTSTTVPGQWIPTMSMTFNETINSISFNQEVMQIGDYAFAYCANLTAIEIPASVVAIGNYAYTATYPNLQFNGSQKGGATSLTFAEGSKLEYVGQGAFAAIKITSAVLPEKVRYIGDLIFKDGSVTEITLLSNQIVEMYSKSNPYFVKAGGDAPLQSVYVRDEFVAEYKTWQANTAWSQTRVKPLSEKPAV